MTDSFVWWVGLVAISVSTPLGLFWLVWKSVDAMVEAWGLRHEFLGYCVWKWKRRDGKAETDPPFYCPKCSKRKSSHA